MSDSEAVLAPERAPLTSGRLFAEAHEFGTSVKTLSIDPDNKVAIAVPYGPEMGVGFLYFACGAVAAPLNPAGGDSEFEFYLADLEAKALLVQAGVTSPAVMEWSPSPCHRVYRVPIASPSVLTPHHQTRKLLPSGN